MSGFGLEISSEDPTSRFELLDLLGHGSYGSVHKALDRTDGSMVAVKTIAVEEDISDLIKEIRILKECKSDEIVAYKGAYQKNEELWVRIFLNDFGNVDCNGVLWCWICFRFNDDLSNVDFGRFDFDYL